jgi:hypothetical protein
MTDQSFDLGKMIGEVELYVGIPQGSIWPFFQAEQEWVFVLKTASMVETVLKSAIYGRIRVAEPWAGRTPATGLYSLGQVMGTDQRTPLRDHVFRLALRA